MEKAWKQKVTIRGRLDEHVMNLPEKRQDIQEFHRSTPASLRSMAGCVVLGSVLINVAPGLPKGQGPNSFNRGTLF